MLVYDVELSPTHYKILKVFYKRKQLSPEAIEKIFTIDELRGNFPYLHTNSMLITHKEHIDGADRYIGDTFITSLGKNAFLIMRDNRRRFWLQGIWLPIIISVITHILLHTLEWLFPLIQQWVANIP